MRKALSFLLCAVMVFTVFAHTVMAEDTPIVVTFVASEEGFDDKASIDGQTITKNGVSVTFSKASGSTTPVYYANGSAFRLYAKNTMTVTAKDSITSIVLTLVSSNTGTLGASIGEYTLSGSTGTWAGEAESVVITNNASSGHARIQQITVTIGGSGSTQPDPVYTTPEEILTAAYELSNGQTLAGGPYTLTGTVIEVNTPYYAPNNYITVTIAVEGLEDMPIQCYKLVNGEVTAIDKIAKNDMITVQGEIKKYNGTVEFDSGCLLNGYTAGEHEEVTIYETPEEILAAAYELESGAYLSEGHVYTLEGTVTVINTAYSSSNKNITVTIEVDDVTAENNSIMCYRMVNGTGVEYIDQLKVGDHITVSGMIKKYNTTVEFDTGCTLDAYEAAEAPTYETPEEIVNALYELDPGATLPGGPYTLSGVITSVTEKYNAQYKDITVVMVVGDMTDKPIMCYYMINGEGVDGVSIIGVGDEITVKGELTHYQNNSGVSTYEFARNCELTEFTAYSKFASKQISLAGDIGVHFYMDLRSLSEAELAETYMEFTVSGKTVTAEFDPENMNASGEYYGFTCRVNTLQMAENIHAVFHYGDSTVETDYSVEEYIEYVDEHSEDYDEAMLELVAAINDYGFYAQLYLEECNGVKLGEGGYAKMGSCYLEEEMYDVVNLSDYAVNQVSAIPDNGKFSYDLLLDSATALELYVTSGELTATFNGKDLNDAEKVGKRERLTISGICAQDLDKEVEVKVDGTVVRRLSALSYANAVISNDNSTEAAVNCMWALVNLYVCANVYIN